MLSSCDSVEEIFVVVFFSAGGGRSARHPWPTASHPTALATEH